MARILSAPSLDERFSQFIRDFYAPNGSFVLAFVTFLSIPYFLLFVVQMLGKRYLCYLVPRSSINIGLSSRRYLYYVNVFKFIIFTVVIGSLLGIAVNFISDLLNSRESS